MSTFPNNEPPLPTYVPSTPMVTVSNPLPEDATSILGVAFTKGTTPFATGLIATSTVPRAISTVVSSNSTARQYTVALVSDHTSTTVDTVDKPPKPNMGGLEALSKNEWAAWTGDKPLYDWSGLDPSARTDYITPNQLRPSEFWSGQKSYNYRCTGLSKERQYSSKTNLSFFQKSVWKHLRNCGMDTISYLPDPQDPTKMTSVVTNHTRFILQTAKTLGAIQLTKYDPYDFMNDVAARTFLLESLTPSIRNKIEEQLEDDDPFFVVWLKFIQTVQSTCINRIESSSY
jgi:hypothetical protein